MGLLNGSLKRFSSRRPIPDNFPILVVSHFNNFSDLSLEKSWLTIGIFDGVHRGHQEILKALIYGAHAAGMPAVVLTFSPHPAVVLGGKTDFKYLTTPDERTALLESIGVDIIVTQPFDQEFANQTAEQFMENMVLRLGLKQLVLGYDTALGRGRTGNAVRLTEIGKDLGYSVTNIPPLSDQAGIISSTRIRQNIAIGDVSSAAFDLGRPFSVAGQVVHGHERGRTINIPTANIQIPSNKIFPAFGIYACRAWVDGTPFLAATSIGVRPTFFETDLPLLPSKPICLISTGIFTART